ncbi:MAG: patatin-like phospholipase family protein, partial [Bryobacteraceae bacterium]
LDGWRRGDLGQVAPRRCGLNSNARTGLVLSGGGARAAYEVGVLKAIYSGRCPAAPPGTVPEVFCGTGAGAFNASVIASRLPGQFPAPVDYLQSLWADEIPQEGKMRHSRVYRRRLDFLQFLDIPYMWRRPLKPFVQFFGDLAWLAPQVAGRTAKAFAKGSFSGWLDLAMWNDLSPMERLISESVSLGVIRDGEQAKPLRLLRVVATEKDSGKAQVFTNKHFNEEVGYRLILASCALPIMFPPVEINGKEFLYGGLVMQTPLQPAVDAGCRVIHMVQNEPRTEARPPGEDASSLEASNRSLAITLSAILERDLEDRRRHNFSAKDPSGRIIVHQHRPKKVLGGKTGLLDFSRENIEAAIAAGEQDALRHDCAQEDCIL